MPPAAPPPHLSRLGRCFSGVVPAVIATTSADGIPNVTYLSRAHPVDDERIALSNQFFSKTVRNLAENPRASLLLVDPLVYQEYRLDARLRADRATGAGLRSAPRRRRGDRRHHRHERRVPVARRRHLSGDPDRGAHAEPGRAGTRGPRRRDARRAGDRRACSARIGALPRPRHPREHDDRRARRDPRLRARAPPARRRGGEVAVHDRQPWLRRREHRRRGRHRRRDRRHGCGSRRTDAGRQPRPDGQVRPHGPSVLGGAGSRRSGPRAPGAGSASARRAGWRCPAMALGQLVGVLVADSTKQAAFGAEDEATLAMVAAQFAALYEALRAAERSDDTAPPEAIDAPRPTTPPAGAPVVEVRFFPVDGSTFLDGDYLIKGVAGRILWSLVSQHGETVGSSSPTGSCASTRRSSCRDSRTTSRADSSCSSDGSSNEEPPSGWCAPVAGGSGWTSTRSSRSRDADQRVRSSKSSRGQ